jgi:hypothetical protein
MADESARDDNDEYAVVIARIGDWELGHKDSEGRNLEAWITQLRSSTLLAECNGIPTTRQAMIQALTRLNTKAVAFQKKFFSEHIVELKACDFRADPKVDRSARVALCESPNLSVRYVGQPVLALALDRTKLRAMNRDEFRGILVSLGAFYDVEHAPLEDGPAARQQHRKYVGEIELMRATRAMAAATL